MVLPEKGCEYSFVVFTKLVKQNEQEIGTQCFVENFPDLEWFTTYPTPPMIVESGTARVFFSICSPISSANQEANDGFDTCHSVSGACYVKGRYGTYTLYIDPTHMHTIPEANVQWKKA